MADATAGNRLARRHGVALYSAQTTWGTAVTPATSVGNALVNHTKVSGNTSHYGPGSPNRRSVSSGSSIVNWEMSFPEVQTGTKTLITKGVRSSGILPLITLGFGYSDDVATPNRSADQIQDCKIGNVSLSLDASGGHGPLSCTLSGMGTIITALTTLAPATLTTTPWHTFEAVLTRAGAAFPVVNWSMELNHNLTADYIIPGAAPTSLRTPVTFTEHNETITGSMSLRTRTGVSVQADCVSTFASVLTLTNVCDSVTLTVTFAGMSFDNERLEMGEDGLMWTVDYEAQTVTIA